MARFDFPGVPTVGPSGPSAGAQTIQASPAAFGAAAAQGLETLGGGVEHTAEAGLSYEQAKQNLLNETHASQLNTWLADKITDRYSQFAKLEGSAAQYGLPAFKADIQKLYDEHLAQAGDNAQLRAQLAKNGSYLTDAYYRYGTNHADQQFSRWQDQTSALRAATYGNQAAIAFNNGDPRGMEVALNTSDDEVAKRLEARGFDQDTIAQQVRVNRGHNLKTIIEAQADTDPVAASALYRKYEKQMDAQSSLAVQNKLRGALSVVQGHRIADEETGRVMRDDAQGTVNGALERASKATGVPLGTLRTFARIESGGNPGVGNGSHRGLFQLSDSEFQRYGGGNVLDANDNALAAARKIKAESEDFATQYGRQPTAGELYLIHQQGAGGYAAHLANPDQPAWRNMLSTAEGRQKGEAWAKAAIWGNVPDRDKAAFGSVDNVTSRQFMALWQARVGRDGSGPLPDKAQVFNAITARTANNPAIQAAALTRMGQIYAVAHQDDIQATAAFNLRRQDANAEALATGNVAQPIAQDEYVRNLGPVAGLKAYDFDQRNVQLGADIRAVASMSPDQIAQLQEKYRPNPGEGFADQEKRAQVVGEAVKKRQAALRGEHADPADFLIRNTEGGGAAWGVFQKRMADPARSPQERVQDAAVYAAQMRALQEHAGLSPDQMRLLPKSYTANVSAKLTAAANDDDPKKRVALIGQVAQEAALWGTNWPAVMREIGGNSLPVVRAIGADVDADGHPQHPDTMMRLLSLKPTDTPKIILGAQTKVTPAQLTTAVDAALADFRGSLMPLQLSRDYPQYFGLTEKLAALHVRDGDTAEVASRKAFNELLGDRYAFRDTWRMPRDAKVSVDDVQRGTQAVRAIIADNSGVNTPRTDNLDAARREMNLTPQEQDLYRRHLTNLTSGGGVDNADGSRSTLFQMSFERDGRTYNIPTVWEGRILKPDEAIRRAEAEGLARFPSYGSTAEAEARYARMHAYMERDTARFMQQRQGAFGIEPFRDNMGLQGENRADSLTKFARDGRFVTSPGNDGLNLYVWSARRGTSLPVTGADGKPIVWRWADLARLAPQAPQADYRVGP